MRRGNGCQKCECLQWSWDWIVFGLVYIYISYTSFLLQHKFCSLLWWIEISQQPLLTRTCPLAVNFFDRCLRSQWTPWDVISPWRMTMRASENSELQKPIARCLSGPILRKVLGIPNVVENHPPMSPLKVVGLSVPFQHVWTVVKGGDL